MKERKLSQLKKADQNMVRTLVTDLHYSGEECVYSEKDVQNRFGITRRSIAAIKANLTR